MLNLIFDLDGCLINSEEVQKAAFFGSYNQVVGDNNCPSYEEYIKHTGDSIDNVLKKMELPCEMAEVFRNISSQLINKVVVNWDAIELIRRLKYQGNRIAICTGKDRYRVVDILKYYNIYDLFDALVCADDVTEPKPSAIPVLKGIHDLNAQKESVLLIGDGYNDILSAKNAGVQSALVLWYGDEGVPREADYIVNSVRELEKIIYNMLINSGC